MPGSPAFARIRAEVFAVARAIPPGRLSTFGAVGAFLDVMPRHVAYLLALPNDEERETAPWHRIVPNDGRLARVRRDAHGRTQAELLAAEGVLVDERGRIADLAARLHPLSTAGTGVVPTPHPGRATPADRQAPRAAGRASRPSRPR